MNFKRSRGRSRKNSTFNVVTNLEKWKNNSTKIKRNSNDHQDESEEEDVAAEVKDWVKEFFGRISQLSKSEDAEEEIHLNKKQTTILSTLVPDELIIMDNLNTPETKRFVGVLLMADVSGYTALSEKYNAIGKAGTYRLTVTLNTYLGALVELIYSHGGDIIKFAGDAFLALWKTDKSSYLSHTIHAVICCALVIQHSYATYETDVKVNLKVKLAISAGNLTFATIGSGADMNYVIIGLPVLEAKAAESVCTSGKVSLAPTAWAHCYTRNYDYILHDDGHVTINAILYDPREPDVSKPFFGLSSMIRQIKPTLNCATTSDSFWDHLDAAKTNYLIHLRSEILLAQEKDIGSYIRKFMIKPVLTQVDAHQPLEYLTEMRQVSILFITLKPTECPLPQLISIIDSSYQITCEIVYKSLGCINKIILFDKDVMILVIFGLRGFKHESEAQAALKCACVIRKSVSALDGVTRVSIGVTTGVVYCGVIGHPLRREFTVIGAIVNKAARLMCYYHNKITCDENTFLKSKMSSNGFILQPALKLKGIEDAGKIYEFKEEIRVKELFNIPVIPPLLDRTDEIEQFQNWLLKPRQNVDALLFIGEIRIGKTRLLEWLKRCAEKNNFNTSFINLTSIHCSTPFLAINQIVNQILDLREPISGFRKEEKILELMNNQFDDLCYLNEVINVRFAYHEGIFSQDKTVRKNKSIQIFQKLVNAIFKKYVIFYDDLQNLDASSWEYIELMFTSPNIFTVISLNRGKLSPSHNWLSQVLNNDKIQKIVLGPLASQWIPSLACQILDVDAIPRELCKAIMTQCKGMPGTIENFLVHRFSTGTLAIQTLSNEELEELDEEDLVFPEVDKIVPTALNIYDQPYLTMMQEANSTNEKKVCFVMDNIELVTNNNDQNLDVLIMMQIDSLTPYQQLLLKIGSVIGNNVPRALLENIMYENDPLITAKSIKKFFDMKILSCRQAKDNKYDRGSFASDGANSSLCCDCDFYHDPENNENLPKYAFCNLMRFKNKTSRKTCYELLPLNQKKEFHTRILNYLENNYRQKCVSCGGQILLGPSVALSSTDVHDVEITNTTEEGEDHSLLSYTRGTSFMADTDEPQIPFDAVSKSSNVTPYRYSVDNTNDETLGRRPAKRVTILKKHFDAVGESFEPCIFDAFRPVLEAKKIRDWRELGISDSTENLLDGDEFCNQYIDIRVESGVSTIDFSKCTCEELTIQIHEQIIYHAIQAEFKVKAMKFLIKYSYLNLRSNNPENVIPNLTQAEEICMEKKNVIKKSKLKKYLGQIYSLRAYALIITGNLLAAKVDIEHASKVLKIQYFKVSTLYTLLDKFNMRGTLDKVKFKKCRRDVKQYVNDVLFYNVVTLVYSTLGEEKIAKAASLLAVKLARCILHSNVTEALDAFSNALSVEIDMGFSDMVLEIENVIKDTVKKFTYPIRGDEVYALGKLLYALFRAEVVRGQLVSGIRYGYQAAVVSRFLCIDSILLELVPELFYILMCRGRIEEAVRIVKLLSSLKNSKFSDDRETWYYALSLDMILDGGFQLESIDGINQFGEELLRKRRYSTDSCCRRLAAGLWVYWLRTGKDKKAKNYEEVAINYFENKEEDGSLTTIMSALRLAEGMLESLSKKIDDLRRVVHLMELRSVAEKELNRLQGDAELMQTIYPRWVILKAHALSICNLKSSATIKYNHAYEKAKKHHNQLEMCTVKALTSESNFWQRNSESGVFPNFEAIKEYVSDSWHIFMYKMMTANLTLN